MGSMHIIFNLSMSSVLCWGTELFMYVPPLAFPGGSAGKESICNEGDLGSIPGSGRCLGDGNSYPLQYSWAPLVAQTVKNLPAMRETWVRSLGWEEPLEKGTATHSSILAWRIPWTEETARLQSMGSQRVGHSWATFTFMLPLMFILGNYFKEVIPELVECTAGFNQSGF